MLTERALALKHAARAGRNDKPLHGKHFGLICQRPDSCDAELFRRAASQLGARVACIAPNVGGPLDAIDVANTSRLLSRLYDAVECQGLPTELVVQLRSATSIPVFDCIAWQSPLDAQRAAAIDAQTGDTDGRFFLLQARLIGVFSCDGA
ncbi:MAG TPA: ornithine carbamoyltransferase [Burkholderiaceae bacterium]